MKSCTRCFRFYNCYNPSEDSEFDAETCEKYQE